METYQPSVMRSERIDGRRFVATLLASALGMVPLACGNGGHDASRSGLEDRNEDERDDSERPEERRGERPGNGAPTGGGAGCGGPGTDAPPSDCELAGGSCLPFDDQIRNWGCAAYGLIHAYPVCVGVDGPTICCGPPPEEPAPVGSCEAPGGRCLPLHDERIRQSGCSAYGLIDTFTACVGDARGVCCAPPPPPSPPPPPPEEPQLESWCNAPGGRCVPIDDQIRQSGCSAYGLIETSGTCVGNVPAICCAPPSEEPPPPRDASCPDSIDPRVRYVSEDLAECREISYKCPSNTVPFLSNCGCGCLGYVGTEPR